MPDDKHPDQDPAEGSRETIDRELKRQGGKSEAQEDSAGQSESRHSGGSNDGVSSAEPRSLSGRKSGDATNPRAWND